VPRVKYAMDYRPKNSFSMSYASRKVIFPGEYSTSIVVNAPVTLFQDGVTLMSCAVFPEKAAITSYMNYCHTVQCRLPTMYDQK